MSDDAPYLARRDLPHIPKRPQTQRALNDQLNDLASVAIKLGLYDAADFILRTVYSESPEAHPPPDDPSNPPGSGSPPGAG